jgi:hypothetical protein
MSRAAGDRRDRVRFEVFGFFWGTLDVQEAVTVHNLTSNGALIEIKRPLAVESLQSVCLVTDGQTTVAEARVRHVRPAASGNFFVGVEFHSTSSAFQEAIERLIAFRSFPTEVA